MDQLQLSPSVSDCLIDFIEPALIVSTDVFFSLNESLKSTMLSHNFGLYIHTIYMSPSTVVTFSLEKHLSSSSEIIMF